MKERKKPTDKREERGETELLKRGKTREKRRTY